MDQLDPVSACQVFIDICGKDGDKLDEELQALDYVALSVSLDGTFRIYSRISMAVG